MFNYHGKVGRKDKYYNMGNMSNASAMGETINWIFKAAQVLAGLALPIIAWAWTTTWAKIATIEKDIVQLRVDMAQMQSNRFTSGDWISAKTNMDERDNELDRRMTKNEEIIINMKETVQEMKVEQKTRFNEITDLQKELLKRIPSKNVGVAE